MIRRRKKKDRRAETPTESTGQLLWLVFAVLVAGAPHLLHLHPWVPFIVLSIIAWRLFAATRRWSLPSIWVRVPLTLLGFLAVLFSYRQVSGLGAGSALLLVMVSMKLLETRGHRDRAVVVFICYFLLFAAFLREQAIWSAGYLLAGVLVTTAALYQTARVGTVVPAPRAMAMAFRLVLQSVPLMLLLFFLFPRIPGPFWALPTGSGQALTGLTNEMTPGDITELAQSDKVAFRVRFDDAVPEPNELYWRGPVMTRFDGRTWSMGMDPPPPNRAVNVKHDGRFIDYELTLEPHGQRWLLALETPVRWDARQAELTYAYQLYRIAPVDQRISYRGTSSVADRLPRSDSVSMAAFFRDISAPGNPRAKQLAASMRAESADDREFVDRMLQMFREQEFFYSLTPPKLGDDSVDEFLFDTRRGFCGHFASAFTVLARAAGIPARVVTGYQGAEFNPLGSYWIVRQSDAHAWAEVWIDEQWLRYDPTAAVAPWRIERGFASGAQTGAGAVGALRSNSFVNRLAMSWDAINAGWNRWVLSFGPDAQTTMMTLAGIDKPATEYLVVAMAVSVTLALIVVGLAQRRHHRPQRDGLQIAYERLCARLGTAARTRDPQEGPREYANAVLGLRPDLAGEATPLFDAYIALRYDRSAATDEVAEFAAAVRRFRPRAGSPATARA